MDEAIANVLASRGGVHQHVHTNAGAPVVSVFAERLEAMWAWGLISAVGVQWLAEGCVIDKVVSERTKHLASIGTAGAYSGNCRRDLLVLAVPRNSSLKPLPFTVPILDQEKIQLSKQCIVSPIQIVEHMFKGHNQLFHETFGTGKLDDFWNNVCPDDPKLIDHPMLAVKDWKSRAIPIVVHGDYGRFTRNSQNSLMVASWRPLLNEDFGVGTPERPSRVDA